MKTLRIVPLSAAVLAALGAFIWYEMTPRAPWQESGTDESPPPLPAREPQPPPRKTDAADADPPREPAASVAPVQATTVVWRDPYAPALSSATLEREERRRFQPQAWEFDLAKGLRLQPGDKLERRSGIFTVPGLPYSRLRLDRVYRLGGPVAAKAAASAQPRAGGAKTATSEPAAELTETIAASVSQASPDRVGPTDALDAGGGELVWSNAMVADHLMVQVENGITRERLAASLPPLARIRGKVSDRGLFLVEVPAQGERSLERAMLALHQLKGVVQFAEPDFCVTGGADPDPLPNDTLFPQSGDDPLDPTKQWHHAKISSRRAWSVLRGPPFNPTTQQTQYQQRLNQTVVAIVDTGFDYTHPDLAPRVWLNPGETGTDAQGNLRKSNGVDDDQNGKIDDWQGWDFIGQHTDRDTIQPDNDPMDDVGHGTHVAGLVGAVGNNGLGVTGVCWDVRLLNLRIIKKSGTGTVGFYSGAVAALSYIAQLNNQGRRVAVANHSWGGGGYSRALLHALAPPVQISCVLRPQPYGVIHVAAAGNSRQNVDFFAPTYPACLRSGFVMSIAATDLNDDLSVWESGRGSNFGALNVDLCAPGGSGDSTGVGIWSTYWKPSSTIINGFVPITNGNANSTQGYLKLRGTSMAAPQVAGAIALVRMYQPALTELQVRQIVVDQADPIDALSGKCAARGRLNLAKIVDRIYSPNLVTDGAGQDVGSGNTIEALGGGQALYGRLSGTTGRSFFTLASDGILGWGGNAAASAIPGAPPPLPSSPAAIPVPPDGVVMINGFGNGPSQGCLALCNDGCTEVHHFRTGVTTELAGMENMISIVATETRHVGVKVDPITAIRTVWYVRRADPNDPDNLNYTMAAKVTDGVGGDFLGAVQVQSDGERTYAVKGDGTVWGWGYDALGVAETPVQVAGLENITVLSGFEGGGLAGIRDDGTVWEWGRLPGQAVFQVAGTQRLGLTKIVHLARGLDHALAIDSDGRMFAWGANEFGQLGVGIPEGATEPPDFTETPIELHDPEGVFWTSVTASSVATAALTSDGEVYTWGDNSAGTLGIGRDAGSSLPIEIGFGGAVASVSHGLSSGCYAARADGTLFRWGPQLESGGESGVGAFIQAPEPVAGIAGVTQVFAGRDTKVVLAVRDDGSLWSWGWNGLGQLGRGAAASSYFAPEAIPGVTGIAACAIGSNLVVALTTAGEVKQWGQKILSGNQSTIVLPEDVPGLAQIAQIACGSAHQLALDDQGKVWTWGLDRNGELGRDLPTDTYDPTPERIDIGNLPAIVSIAAGFSTSWALDASGAVWVWGVNPRTHIQQPTPVRLETLDANPVPVALAGGTRLYAYDSQLFILRNDGVLFGMLMSDAPDSPRRQLARDPASTAAVTDLAPVVGIAGVAHLSTGENATDGVNLALTASGRVFTWGYGFGGALGDSASWSDAPVKAHGFAGIVDELATLGTVDIQSSWLLGNFSVGELLDEHISAPGADPDKDGLNNLLEYALGTDPRVPTRNPLSLRIDLLGASAQSESAGQMQLFCALPGGELTDGKHYQALTIPRHGIKQDIDYIVEVSSDLVTWLSGNPYTIPVLNTADTLEVYDAAPREDAPRRYMRLKIFYP